MPRSADGTISSGQLLAGAIDLYAAAGAIRLQLLALIEAANPYPDAYPQKQDDR